MADLPPIDWDLVARTGARVAKPGPRLTRDERGAAVASLHASCDEAHGHALRVTGLPDPGGPVPVLVVGRARWVELQTASARRLMAGVLDDRPRGALGLADKVRARAYGAQAGAALGFIAGKILGQFDPFAEPDRMTLVAPNVIEVERELGVEPRDFRLWVCVHEQTHRLQFARAPWLRAHLQELLHSTVEGFLAEPPEPVDATAPRRPRTIMDAFASPAQRHQLDEVTAVMSVLEGYADVMMNRVGPETIPTVERIRELFAKRRRRRGMDVLVRKLLALDAKMAQYRDGARFCRRVIELRDLPTLNRVFDDAPGLPSYAELMEPERWLARRGL